MNTVTLGINSLQNQEGNSDKIYQIVGVWVNDVISTYFRVYGPSVSPKQIQTFDGTPIKIQESCRKIFDEKIKTYDQVQLHKMYAWRGSRSDWSQKDQGEKFVLESLKDHGQWEKFTPSFRAKLATALNKIGSFMTENTEDPDDLFMTQNALREKRDAGRRLNQEGEKLINWGAF
jgi:hypothetical protein